MCEQSIQIFKSIEKHLFKTILTNHKTCIKRLQGLLKEEREGYPDICPYAYSYVFWKQTFVGNANFYDNRTFEQNHSKNTEIVAGFFNDDIAELMRLILTNYNGIKAENSGVINWMVLKYLSVIINYYFRYWH